MLAAKLNNPKCSQKTYVTAYSVWTIGFLCIIANIQTMTTASPIHLSIASNDAIINIEIKNKAALNISIGFGSTDHSTELSGGNRLDCKLRDSTIKQLESTERIKATEEDTTMEQIKATEEIKTTEKIETPENIKDLIKQAILNDDENETIRLIALYSDDLNGNEDFQPLQYVAEHCKPKVAKKLIENGADVNIFGETGWRPIHVATYHNCMEIVRELKENGADLEAKISIGYSALDIAKQDGRKEIAKQLAVWLGEDAPKDTDTIDDDSTDADTNENDSTDQSGEGTELTTADTNDDYAYSEYF